MAGLRREFGHVARRLRWRLMRVGEIQYAKADDHHIAYREYVADSGGDQEIVMVNGAHFPMESLPDDPIAHRLLEGLAGLGRLILFDRRGIALSDPVSDWDTPLREQWAEDLAAVIDAADCDQPTVFSWGQPAVARTCAVRRPGLIGRLVLFNPTAPVTEDDTPWVMEVAESLRRLRAGELTDGSHQAFPGRARDPAFRAWNDAAGRAGASPSQAERLTEKGWTDPPLDNAQVSTPTLVITRRPTGFVVPEEYFLRAARQIPDAQHVMLPPGDASPVGLGVDDLLVEISRYLTGEVQLPPPERHLAAILFTDLVGSTRQAVESGDTEWKRLLDRHDTVNHTEVVRCGGEVVKTTGDGVLALLPSGTAAIEAARRIRSHLGDEDLEVRVGIHVGEVDRREDDVSGLAVNIAARIMSTAEPNQILTSAVVTQTVDAASFVTVGPRILKGLDGTWELSAVG